MLRAARWGWIPLLVLLAGCTKDEDYLEVYREQRAAYKDLADILATVKDRQSMADAGSAVEERGKKFEAIARKASALPKPPPASVLRRLEDDRFAMEQALFELQNQVSRIRKLEGGEEFLQQFESRSPGLFSAVQR